MSFLIWNCRGAGDRSFPRLVRDCLKIYNLAFMALLEPRISGVKADKVIKRFGVDGFVRVEASGFSGGIWCLWKKCRIAIYVVSTSRYCIHLRVNPCSSNPWLLSVIYASPQQRSREHLWEELRDISMMSEEPWCVAGDFNTVFYESEKTGGAPVNYASCMALASCLDDCNLVDMGFKGPPFTWSRGDLREKLGRAVCNSSWISSFADSSVVNLPLPSSDHCGIWIRSSANVSRRRDSNYFKFLGSWLDHPDFRVQLESSWRISFSWNDNITRLSKSLSVWNREVFGNIFKRKKRIISRLEGIQRVLLSGGNDRLLLLKKDL